MLFKKKKIQRIFPRHIKYVLVLPEYILIALTREPKKITGGYLTQHGRRYVRCQQRSFNRVRLITNDHAELHGED